MSETDTPELDYKALDSLVDFMERAGRTQAVVHVDWLRRTRDHIDTLAAQLKKHEDWSSDDVVDGIGRIRDAARRDGVSEQLAVRCDMLDFPTAWAIQKNHGETLDHDPQCSSVPGWHPLSGPALLCDCGAVEREWQRLCAEAVPAATPPQDAR